MSGGTGRGDGGRVTGEGGVVGNEFAEVAVAVDRTGHSPRLRLEDLRTGRVRILDALELEAIVWLAEGHLTQLLDPAADRWRDDEDAERRISGA